MPVSKTASYLSDLPSEIMNAMGDKISSKKMAIDAQVPIIPGVDYAIKDS